MLTARAPRQSTPLSECRRSEFSSTQWGPTGMPQKTQSAEASGSYELLAFRVEMLLRDVSVSTVWSVQCKKDVAPL
jgi:hypothetical protein